MFALHRGFCQCSQIPSRFLYTSGHKYALQAVKLAVLLVQVVFDQLFISTEVSPIPDVVQLVQEDWIDSATFRDLPYDYATLLENLFDTGHVPFTHHASVSKRSTADVMKLEMKTQGPTGFTGRNEKGPRKGQLG